MAAILTSDDGSTYKLEDHPGLEVDDNLTVTEIVDDDEEDA